MTAKTPTRKPKEMAPETNPFSERHRLRSEIAASRVARDTAQGQLRQLEAERKEADAEAFTQEMAMVTDASATKLRDAAVERLRGCDTAKPQYERALEAASQLTSILEGKLALLHDEEFDQFVKEAESAAYGCQTELLKLRKQAAVCADMWSKASALWRPLQKPLLLRLEQLNAVDGVYPDTIGQSICRAFPIDIAFIKTIAPRPSGIERLNRAGRNGT